MTATGAEIRELGANEMAEGLVRKIAAAAMAKEREELAAATELESAARDIASVGLAEAAVGAANDGGG